ncbi:MAG TPA: UDP-N-acetylglucosamine 2-epimerase [Nitrospiraceae bacterium]|nr:UDP-N-acetylglucosamine 2-epimerase [Nitrospiraceae bacterium]
MGLRPRVDTYRGILCHCWLDSTHFYRRYRPSPYQIPCLTLRDNTERPVTVTMGTNRVIGADPSQLPAAVGELLNGDRPTGQIPPLCEGRARERIAAVLT